MKFLPLLALAALATLTGCETQYTRLTSANHEGTVSAVWIAEGPTRKIDQGYRISAVERSTYGTDPVSTRYPNGWRTIATGPNILLEPVSKPHWLVELDSDRPVEGRRPEPAILTGGR